MPQEDLRLRMSLVVAVRVMIMMMMMGDDDEACLCWMIRIPSFNMLTCEIASVYTHVRPSLQSIAARRPTEAKRFTEIVGVTRPNTHTVCKT